MALTPELKATRALKEMFNQRDYSRYHFALMLLNDNTNDAVALAAAIVEMAAIRADVETPLPEHEREWLMAAWVMRNAIVDKMHQITTAPPAATY